MRGAPWLEFREPCAAGRRRGALGLEALGDTRDAEVRDVLRTIARDELRHATLAWRTLRWMVTSGLVTEDAARAALARGLAAMKENASFPGRHAMGDDLRAFGVLSDKRRGELRLAPANKVIATCTAALLGGRTSLLANALE